jgi:hypothetical protein
MTVSSRVSPARDGSRWRLVDLLPGFLAVQPVYVMARLELADLLVDGSTTVDELGSATEAKPDILGWLIPGTGVGLVSVEAGAARSI